MLNCPYTHIHKPQKGGPSFSHDQRKFMKIGLVSIYGGNTISKHSIAHIHSITKQSNAQLMYRFVRVLQPDSENV